MEMVHMKNATRATASRGVLRKMAPVSSAGMARSHIHAIVHGGASVQAKAAVDGQGYEPSGATRQAIAALRGGGQALQRSTREYFESRFGRDFSQVRVHDDSRANTLARSIHARAFTYGNDVVFGASEYRPDSHEGRRLIAHELTHTVQQGKGSEVVRRQSTVCCAGDEMEPIITHPASFNINEYIDIPSGPTWPAGEFCTKRRCVKIRVKSKWVSRHGETKFRVKLFNYTTSTVTSKDFNVGSDVNSYSVPRCSNFYIRVEVINPDTSPNLKGKLWMNYC